jgi:SAM-dependent methyltransferase
MTLLSDPLAIALSDPEPGSPLIVERTDGHRSITDLAWWRRDPEAAAPADAELVSWVRSGSTAIDIGCATGRHLELLGKNGVDAVGVDTSAASVERAQEHGLNAICADARTWTPPHQVDTVFAFGGGAGLCGRRKDLRDWLTHLATWIVPGGRIILTSVDWRVSRGHESWLQDATVQARYPGDLTLRLRYRDHVGPWFDWAIIDPHALTLASEALGLGVARLQTWSSKYALELIKPKESS